MDPIYFEDIEVGKKVKASEVYEVTQGEIVEFARRWDPRPFHTDENAAASSIFGGLAACSAHIFSIASWFASRGNGCAAVLAALGFDRMCMHHAVRPGDILSCDTECLEKRESNSNPDRAVVSYLRSLTNQHGKVVFSVRVTILVARKPL